MGLSQGINTCTCMCGTAGFEREDQWCMIISMHLPKMPLHVIDCNSSVYLGYVR